MCLLFLIQIIIYNSLMSKIKGRFFSMNEWIHYLDFEILGNFVKGGLLVTYMQIVGYVYLIAPFITLILWAAFMYIDASKNSETIDHENPVFMGGVSIILIAIAIFLAMTAVNKISWNKYRFKFSHLFMLIIAYASFTAW